MATLITPLSVRPTKLKVSKKPRPSFAERKAFAEQMSGYNDQSPIWNKPLPEVLNMIEGAVANGHPQQAGELIQELRRRIAKGQLMKAQS